MYNSYEGWHVQFPFWSISTIRRVISRLEKEHLILTGNFNRLKLDKTKWYRINFEALEGIYYDEEVLSSAFQNEGDVSVRSIQEEQNEVLVWSAIESKLTTPIPETTSEITSEKEVVKRNARTRAESIPIFRTKWVWYHRCPPLGKNVELV